MTILSAQSIRKFAEDGRSIITPFSSIKHIVNGKSYGLSSCGYDVRIAETLTLFPNNPMKLASTMEHFNMPLNVVATVNDKSSWARKGLAVQNTVIEPGWRGYLTLEVTNHGPDVISLLAGDPIAQILFQWLDKETDTPYTGKYQDQAAGPQPAIEEVIMMDGYYEGEWCSASILGDYYEVEINAQTGNYRHRLINLRHDNAVLVEWTPGRPPEGPHAIPT